MEKIYIASDHGGFNLKGKIINFLEDTYINEFSIAEWIVTIVSAIGAVILMWGLFKIFVAVVCLLAG